MPTRLLKRVSEGRSRGLQSFKVRIQGAEQVRSVVQRENIVQVGHKCCKARDWRCRSHRSLSKGSTAVQHTLRSVECRWEGCFLVFFNLPASLCSMGQLHGSATSTHHHSPPVIFLFTSVCLVSNRTTDARTTDLVARVDRHNGCVHGDEPHATGETTFYGSHEENDIV